MSGAEFPPARDTPEAQGDLGALGASPGAPQPAHTSLAAPRRRVNLSRVMLLVGLLVLGAGGALARSESSYLRIEPGPAPDLAKRLEGSVVDPDVRTRSYLLTTVQVESLSWGRYWYEQLSGAEGQYLPADPSGNAVDPSAAALQMRESKRIALALARSEASGGGAVASSGVIVSRVVTGSAAAAAKLAPGDRIVSYTAGSAPLPAGTSEMFVARVSALPEGTELTLALADGSERRVRLRGAPGGEGRLGVEVVTEVAESSLEAGVDVDTTGIGGPSGGLVLSLLYLDALTPGDLSGGRVIAGTGTIALDGQVGEISGIGDKVLGAKAAGAQVFFAPASEAALAREAGLGTLQVVGVENLDDAVAWLCANGGEAPSCPDP